MAFYSVFKNAFWGNLYGIVLTPSFYQWGGINLGKTDDVDSTNEALTDALNLSTLYALIGSLIATIDNNNAKVQLYRN
jgi:hypothetical protein